MTYAELVTAVQDYCENTFPTVDMDTMIKQAEQRIYNTVQLASLRKNMVGQLSTGNQYLSAPNDFLSAYSLAVIKANGDYVYLLNKDVNFIRDAYPSSSSTGIPKHYAIFGPVYGQETELSFILGPTPDTSLLSSPNNVELHFYYNPESIVTAGNTWLGDNFDSALLNGTMIEAITYIKGEPDMVKLYQERYVQSIALLKNLGDGKQRMDAYRDGQVRNPVN
jgi:hypothetical protein